MNKPMLGRSNELGYVLLTENGVRMEVSSEKILKIPHNWHFQG